MKKGLKLAMLGLSARARTRSDFNTERTSAST